MKTLDESETSSAFHRAETGRDCDQVNLVTDQSSHQYWVVLKPAGVNTFNVHDETYHYTALLFKRKTSTGGTQGMRDRMKTHDRRQGMRPSLSRECSTMLCVQFVQPLLATLYKPADYTKFTHVAFLENHRATGRRTHWGQPPRAIKKKGADLFTPEWAKFLSQHISKIPNPALEPNKCCNCRPDYDLPTQAIGIWLQGTNFNFSSLIVWLKAQPNTILYRGEQTIW